MGSEFASKREIEGLEGAGAGSVSMSEAAGTGGMQKSESADGGAAAEADAPAAANVAATAVGVAAADDAAESAGVAAAAAHPVGIPDPQPALAGHPVLRQILRYLICALGIVINSFGIAFITEGSLGTSPISSVPYVISLRFEDWSFGTVTFIMNMIFILVQIILLRREFKPIQLLQILANLLFSVCIDISTSLLWWFQPSFIPLQILSVLLGCLILALGIAIEVAPNAVVVPGEGIVRAITRVTKIRFGTVKICFDVSLVVIALVLSIVFFGGIRGLGLGTIICALIVGWLVNQIDEHLPLIRHIRRLAL